MDVYTKDVMTHEYNRQYAQAVRTIAERQPLTTQALEWAHIVAATITKQPALAAAFVTPDVYDCDGCGEDVVLVTNPRDLVIVLCAACNKGTPIC